MEKRQIDVDSGGLEVLADPQETHDIGFVVWDASVVPVSQHNPTKQSLRPSIGPELDSGTRAPGIKASLLR